MDHYENPNRAFVQLFLAHNVLTFDQARSQLAAIFSVHENKIVRAEDISQDDFDSMIAAANDALSPLDYEIRTALHQETRLCCYALVNATSDALTQMATIHSTDEIAYLRRLLDAMFETNNDERKEAMCVAGKDALNLVRSDRSHASAAADRSQTKLNMTQTDAEAFLSRLLVEGWLGKSNKGFYSLTPRALMELKGWLVETYNDEENQVFKIKTCHACREIITTVSRLESTIRGRMLTECRVSDVRLQPVLYDCTASALKTFFGLDGHETALDAESNGTGTTSLEKRPSPPRTHT